jgi:hypothetical protein
MQLILYQGDARREAAVATCASSFGHEMELNIIF